MVQRRGEGIHMNRGRVGEEKGGKETDRCPLTEPGSKLWRANHDSIPPDEQLQLNQLPY
jgi:hypothetical protein